MNDRIRIRGLRFYGHHGVDPAEQAVGQWYRIDLDLWLDLRPAGMSDELERSVDYGSVCRDVLEIGTQRRFRLIEALAEAVATRALERHPADRVRVRVRKTPPAELAASLAERGSLEYTAVEIERRRSD